MGSATRLAPTRPTMKHNNQIHSVRKFRKYWQRYVKTWFNQPARKKSRRDARHKKAAAIAPRPVAGCVRPLVHPPTVKYNSKTRIGRGFSVAEIKGAKLSKLEAKSLGISVDYRRRNKSVEGKQLNEQRLREYRATWWCSHVTPRPPRSRGAMRATKRQRPLPPALWLDVCALSYTPRLMPLLRRPLSPPSS